MDEILIDEVLCNSGSEFDLRVEQGEPISGVVEQAGHALDGACLTNVVVMRAGGKLLVGEFGFTFREVDEEEGQRVAREFGGEESEAAIDHEIFQESPRKKARWVREMEVRFPVGCRVKVTSSDVDAYVGKTGIVADYDVGVDGDWPLVSVVFDAPFKHDGEVVKRDGFCDDEIERVEGP